MNKENKLALKKAVKVLTSLHFKPENIMVTGSIALDFQGMCPYGRTAHDVDLIIKMDDKTWRCMKLIEAINQVDEEGDVKDEYSEKKYNTIFLKTDDGLVLNIWRYEGEWSDIKDAETGVYVATVKHIIEAKKKYARPKDYQDINAIVKQII